MKKVLFCLLALISSMSLFTACSSDNDEIKYPVEKEIAGTYKGKMDVYIVGVSEPVADDLVQKVYITKASDSAIKLELRNFSIRVGEDNLVIGDISVDKCELSQKGDIYSFTGKQTLNLVVGKCETSVSGTVGKGSVNMDIKVDVAELSMKVEVNYEGERLSGSESSEAKILSFTFDEKYDFITQQPIIDEVSGTIFFRVQDGTKQNKLEKMTPTITFSDRTEIVPNPSEEQDFSNGKIVTYTLTAEDGTVKKYNVSTPLFQLKNDFETWMKAGGEGDKTYYAPAGWSSSNAGVSLIFDKAKKYVVTQTDDAHSGKSAAKMETVDTKGAAGFLGFPATPKVTTGSLFLGEFRLDIFNPLKSTKFGIPFDKKPKSLKGWYKYTAGKEYYSAEGTVPNKPVKKPGVADEFAIKAVLYVTDEYQADLSDCLTGASGKDNIYTSDRVVAIASLEGGNQADWKSFDLKFDYKKVYDPTAKYRFAIICSSSKNGDKYSGAPGSTLIVDDFELIVE